MICAGLYNMLHNGHIESKYFWLVERTSDVVHELWDDLVPQFDQTLVHQRRHGLHALQHVTSSFLALTRVAAQHLRKQLQSNQTTDLCKSQHLKSAKQVQILSIHVSACMYSHSNNLNLFW